MTGQIVSTISADGDKWRKSTLDVPDGKSNYGLQIAVYRGEVYGVGTGSDGHLFATKFKNNKGWKETRKLPDLFKAAGRVSVTVLEDRFFVGYRGTNDGVYLVWTDDFEHWADAGRIGSIYAKSVSAPAIQAFGGDIFIAGVGADAYIYYTATDVNGVRKYSWRKIDGTGTRSALAMGVVDASLVLFHTAYNNKEFFYQGFVGTGWSQLSRQAAPVISSGLSVTATKFNGFYVTYRGDKNSIQGQSFYEGKWSGEGRIVDGDTGYQTGLTTWGGNLVLSYADMNEKKDSYRYRAPIKMSPYVSEKEVEDWDCKWQEQKPEKSAIRKFFCL